MLKKLFYSFLLTAFVWAFMILTVNSATYGDLTYSISNNEVTITGCSTSATSVTIPETIKGFPVTRIGYGAFYSRSSLKSITIPDSVTSISYNAFYNCDSLTNITIPDGVTSIRQGAFYNTAYYNTTNNWENGVLYIGNHLIAARTTVASHDVKPGTKTIADYAFDNCDSLTSITIPDSVTNIGSFAFFSCNSLESVRITDLAAYLNIICENLNSAPMYYADKLYLKGKRVTNLVIPAGVEQIPPGAFHGCDSITSVTIPDSVTSIGSDAFYDCDGLVSIIIPDSVTSIGSYAFHDCDSLANITIPNGVMNIGDSTFSGCISLASIIIPDSVTSIGSYAFFSCISLGGVTIGKGVTSIDNSAFSGCGSLASITFPDSVTSVGSSAFEGCTKLKTAVFGGSVSLIDEAAFSGCSRLEKLVLPKSVREIEINAFSGCTSLTEVEYAGGAADWAEVYIGTGNEALNYVAYKYDSKEANRLGVSMEETATGRTFTIAPVAVEEGTVVYAAIYDKKGELISLGCETVDADNYTTVETQSTPRDATAKVFLFSGARAQIESKMYSLSE